MTVPRVLVTVSRSWRSWSVMREALTQVYARYPGAVLVHGDCPQGDRQAAGMWRELGGSDEPWPANWSRCDDSCRHRVRRVLDAQKRFRDHCPYAGFRRNVAMVESAPDLCLAFIHNGSKGATHCADQAEGAGIPTIRYPEAGAS